MTRDHALSIMQLQERSWLESLLQAPALRDRVHRSGVNAGRWQEAIDELR